MFGWIVYGLIGLLVSAICYVNEDGYDVRAIFTPHVFWIAPMWPILFFYVLFKMKQIKWRGKVVWRRHK